MRRAGFVLIAAVLALAGCKNTGAKTGDKSPAGAAARPKSKEKEGALAKGPTWLDDVGRLPGAGTGIPKGGPGSDPRDPNFDAKAAAQDALGGRVLDPDNKPARNIFIRVVPVGAAKGGPAAPGIDIGIYTDNNGYFLTNKLKPGVAYELTAFATAGDGRRLTGVVQTKVPNPVLLIVLRDDLPPPPVGGLPAPKAGDGGQFPPEPRPSDRVGDNAPAPAAPRQPKPDGGAWTPGGPTTGVPPATIGGSTPRPAAPAPTPGGGAVPQPDDLSTPPEASPAKPENVAEGARNPPRPPAANIPNPEGPPVPALPTLPPSFSPTPGGGRSSMGTQGTSTGGAGKLALVDTMERPWDLESVQPGSLVLVEFTTSTCVPCKQVIPVMKDLQSRYGSSGLQVAGVMCDNKPQGERAATAAKYKRDFHLNYALFVEPGAAGTVRDRYGVESYPTAVLLNSDGRVLWKGHPGEKAKLESAIKQNLGK